jgi:hypothetical protein
MAITLYTLGESNCAAVTFPLRRQGRSFRVTKMAQSRLTAVDQRRGHDASVNYMIEGWTPDRQAVPRSSILSPDGSTPTTTPDKYFVRKGCRSAR